MYIMQLVQNAVLVSCCQGQIQNTFNFLQGRHSQDQLRLSTLQRCPPWGRWSKWLKYRRDQLHNLSIRPKGEGEGEGEGQNKKMGKKRYSGYQLHMSAKKELTVMPLK